MPAPDLAFVKEWCRIDGTEFDLILPTLLTTATTLASHETGHDYHLEPMPEPVKAWCAAQVAYWTDHPSAGTERQMMPSPFHRGLLDPYRRYAWTLDA